MLSLEILKNNLSVENLERDIKNAEFYKEKMMSEMEEDNRILNLLADMRRGFIFQLNLFKEYIRVKDYSLMSDTIAEHTEEIIKNIFKRDYRDLEGFIKNDIIYRAEAVNKYNEEIKELKEKIKLIKGEEK